MNLPISKKAFNYLTNGAGLSGLPAVIKGLGVSNYSALPLEGGTQYSFFFSMQAFDPSMIMLGFGTMVVFYVTGKTTK